MTLITRAGILSWIENELACGSGMHDQILQALKKAIENSSDDVDVELWRSKPTGNLRKSQ